MDKMRPRPDELLGTTTAEKALSGVGLTLHDLTGKKVGIAGSTTSITSATQQAGIVTAINELSPTFVSPIKMDGDFDLVLNLDGQQTGGPWKQSYINNYVQALSLLHASGQVRVFQPFLAEGVGYVLHDSEYDNEKIPYCTDISYVKEMYRTAKSTDGIRFRFSNEEDSDDLPFPEDPFWLYVYALLDPSDQFSVNRQVARILTDCLRQQDVNPLAVEIEVSQPSPLAVRGDYQPYMILRKAE